MAKTLKLGGKMKTVPMHSKRLGMYIVVPRDVMKPPIETSSLEEVEALMNVDADEIEYALVEHGRCDTDEFTVVMGE
jgi:hypothetical protein